MVGTITVTDFNDETTELWYINFYGDWTPLDMIPPPWVNEEGSEYD